MRDRNPTRILRKAVLGMLSRNRLRHGCMEPRLHIYAGAEHPHTAQLPKNEVESLPPVPRCLDGNFHFGLKDYAHPKSHQEGLKAAPTRREVEMMEL